MLLRSKNAPEADRLPGPKYRVIQPVPATAPSAPKCALQHGMPQKVYEFRRGSELYGYTYRFDNPHVAAVLMPCVFACSRRDGALKWIVRQYHDPAPLYLPAGQLNKGAACLIVKDEAHADRLYRALIRSYPEPQLNIVSWHGGPGCFRRASWHWLEGFTVTLQDDLGVKRHMIERYLRVSATRVFG